MTAILPDNEGPLEMMRNVNIRQHK